ncbi:hypothetical protein IU449_28520 [Nocardia higoensis]|uniref:FtsK domain-containing protein n=1 Tax=Nocardia higoensis TaxID=228599 RepID=A0ABS0DJU8_9NOCA|nr:FtsK/SpoIIIE domain-containing protein [Nocardia higoensis]MBF6358445.1 hypothetical protein [Nocardia higoensis]
MGNNHGNGPSADLVLVSLAAGGGVMAFGGLVAYKTMENMGYPGWTGPGGLVALTGTGVGLFVAEKVNGKRAQRRAAERAWREWREFRDTFPPEVHYALDLLANPLAASLMWTHPQVAIGLPPNPAQWFPGTWPQLLPGQDAGHAPDQGIRLSPVGARIRLALPEGYSADHVRNRLPVIASSLHVPRVQVVMAQGHVVVIELRVRNPLARTIRLPRPEPSPVPLKALKVGMQEDGNYYRMRIWSNHLFLAGLTGSGKSGVLWAIIAALAPDIKAGRVELYVIDLKFGSEMAAGDRLFAQFVWEVLDAISVLELLVHRMMGRATPRREPAMRTGQPIRDFEPRPGDPQIVLMIDEILDLLKISADFKITRPLIQLDGSVKEETLTVGKYVLRLLLSLLSRARSFGITIIVATQNAAKDLFDLLRDMFPTMVGLRQASDQQQTMVFGFGAKERGVAATDIGTDEQGTVYIDSPEAGGMAIRARFFRVEDSHITALVNEFGRPADAPRPVLPAPPSVEKAPAKSNVVELRPDTETALVDQLPDEEPGRCRFCGDPLTQTKGGRRALYCNDNHRQQYHRLKAQLEKKAQGN